MQLSGQITFSVVFSLENIHNCTSRDSRYQTDNSGDKEEQSNNSSVSFENRTYSENDSQNPNGSQ